MVFEELIFRGALLVLLCQKFGGKKAILISSVCFGIYHWFTWQAFGSLLQMGIIFLNTGSVGLIYAYAFIRRGSMFLPITLHLGANLSGMLLFSKDQAIGTQLLIKAFDQDPVEPAAFVSIPMFLVHFVGYQCFTFLLLRWYTRVNPKNMQ